MVKKLIVFVYFFLFCFVISADVGMITLNKKPVDNPEDTGRIVNIDNLVKAGKRVTLEGVIGGEKVRINIERKAGGVTGRLHYIIAEENIYDLFEFGPQENGAFRMDFYHCYPAREDFKKYRVTLTGKIGTDGNLSGTFAALPEDYSGSFSLKSVEEDKYSGNYTYEDNFIFMQLQERDKISFYLGNDWCSIHGMALLSGDAAMYRYYYSGTDFFIKFDFSKPGTCVVSSNFDSPDAREQQLRREFCNYRGALYIDGLYISDTVERPTPTPAPTWDEAVWRREFDKTYCFGASDAEKTRTLDSLQGKSYRAPGKDALEFVVYKTDSRHDHGLPTGECGVRVEAYEVKADGSKTKKGTWQDLKAGSFSFLLPAQNHCVISLDGDNRSEKYYSAVFVVDSAGNTVKTSFRGSSDDIMWVTKDGKDVFWEINDDGLYLRNADYSVIWSKKDKEHADIRGSSFSKSGQYLVFDKKGSKDKIIAGIDGKFEKVIKWPFTAKAQEAFGIAGVTDEPGIICAGNERIVYMDTAGNTKTVAILPEYEKRKRDSYLSSCSYLIETLGQNHPLREVEYEAVTNTVKDYPRPKVRFNIETLEAEENLDGKTWKSIDIRVK